MNSKITSVISTDTLLHFARIGFLILVSINAIGQQIKLNRNIKIDTLRVWINYSTEIDNQVSTELQKSAIAGIQKFNEEQLSFIVILDSIPTLTSLRLNVGPINYVDAKDNIIWTTVGLGILAVDAYALVALSVFIPLPPLIPSTRSKVTIENAEGLITTKEKCRRFYINPSGYLRKKNTQKTKMVQKTYKVIYRFFKKLEIQNAKNNKT